MEDTYIEHEHHTKKQGGFMGFVDGLYDFVIGSLRAIGHDAQLFIGVALTIIGLLSFHSDKFCDGNTADYLSCTRPSTYYFYSPVEIAIVVIGVFLIMVWMRKMKRHG